MLERWVEAAILDDDPRACSTRTCSRRHSRGRSRADAETLGPAALRARPRCPTRVHTRGLTVWKGRDYPAARASPRSGDPTVLRSSTAKRSVRTSARSRVDNGTGAVYLHLGEQYLRTLDHEPRPSCRRRRSTRDCTQAKKETDTAIEEALGANSTRPRPALRPASRSPSRWSRISCGRSRAATCSRRRARPAGDLLRPMAIFARLTSSSRASADAEAARRPARGRALI